MISTVEYQKIRSHLDQIGAKILLLSTLDEQTKALFAYQFAQALVTKGLDVGLLESAVKHSYIAQAAQIETLTVPRETEELTPIPLETSLYLATYDLLLNRSQHSLFHLSSRRTELLTELLLRVNWGLLNLLLIDSSTLLSSEHERLLELIFELSGVIIITDGRGRSMDLLHQYRAFCRQHRLAVLALVDLSQEGEDEVQEFALQHDVPYFPHPQLDELAQIVAQGSESTLIRGDR